MIPLLSLATPRNIYWVSDIHLDNHYHAGSPDRCIFFGQLGTRCCRPVYDLPVAGSHPASPWGDYHCDSPETLVRYVFNQTASLFPIYPPSFILQTGDLVDHHDILQDFSHNMHEVGMATSYLAELASKAETGLIMTIGNHDTWPVDQLGPPSHGSTKLTRSLWSMWQRFIPEGQKANFLEGGYYVYPLSETLLMIVLNNLYDDNHNLLIGLGKKGDPGNQDSWLETQLKDARANGKRVWLVGHIPPNTGEADVIYRNLLSNLSSTYRDVIRGQLFGHTHTDSFVVYTDESFHPFSFALVNPSLLPDLHDPSVRILTYDDFTGDILDYQQFYLNLTSLIQTGEAPMTYSYSFREEYGIDQVNAEALYSLIETMKKDPNGEEAQAFSRNFYISEEAGVTPSCDEACVSSRVSSLVFPSPSSST